MSVPILVLLTAIAATFGVLALVFGLKDVFRLLQFSAAVVWLLCLRGFAALFPKAKLDESD